MAKIVKWKQRLAVGLVALFLSMARVWLPETHNSVLPRDPIYSRLLTGIGAKTAFGVELMAQRPYLRLVRASLNPVSLPVAAGAYLATADSLAGVVAPACSSSSGGGGGSCHTYECVGSNGTVISECYSCGTGQCQDMCNAG